jgi:hypothetical protein
MFEELLGSVREAGAVLRGQTKPSRQTAIHASGVKVIREFGEHQQRPPTELPLPGTIDQANDL